MRTTINLPDDLILQAKKAALEADTTLESDYIYYLNILGRAEPGRIAKLANYIRQRQLSDGGWNIYYGGPSELNATVKGYFGLRLAGDLPGAPHMLRAKARVIELGGLEATNSYVRFYLALVGAVGWELVPAIPPDPLGAISGAVRKLGLELKLAKAPVEVLVIDHLERPSEN